MCGFFKFVDVCQPAYMCTIYVSVPVVARKRVLDPHTGVVEVHLLKVQRNCCEFLNKDKYFIVDGVCERAWRWSS